MRHGTMVGCRACRWSAHASLCERCRVVDLRRSVALRAEARARLGTEKAIQELVHGGLALLDGLGAASTSDGRTGSATPSRARTGWSSSRARSCSFRKSVRTRSPPRCGSTGRLPRAWRSRRRERGRWLLVLQARLTPRADADCTGCIASVSRDAHGGGGPHGRRRGDGCGEPL